MRTTLNVDAHVLANAKQRAGERGMTLGELVEESLRSELATPAAANQRSRIPVFRRGTGMQPGVDPMSNRSMREALDADLPVEQLR